MTIEPAIAANPRDENCVDDLLLATVDTVNRQLDEAIAAVHELLKTERAINGR